MTLKLSIIPIALRDGRWEAVLEGAASALRDHKDRNEPAALAHGSEDMAKALDLGVTCGGQELSGLKLLPLPDEPHLFAIHFAIPPETIQDGVQVYLVRQKDVVLSRFTLRTGGEDEADLREEVAFLRAELELLKAAFRRSQSKTSA